MTVIVSAEAAVLAVASLVVVLLVDDMIVDTKRLKKNEAVERRYRSKCECVVERTTYERESVGILRAEWGWD
jgi:hypothetical protein